MEKGWGQARLHAKRPLVRMFVFLADFLYNLVNGRRMKDNGYVLLSSNN